MKPTQIRSDDCSGALGSVAGERMLRAQEKAARATRGMPPPKIKRDQCYCHPAGKREALRGQGHHRPGRPLWVWLALPSRSGADLWLRQWKNTSGRFCRQPADRIEDNLASLLQQFLLEKRPRAQQPPSAAWTRRCGISRGGRPECPVYDLWGGKVREAVQMFANARGSDPKQVVDSVRQVMAQGYRHVE